MAKKKYLKIDDPLRYDLKAKAGGKIKQTKKDIEKNRQRVKPRVLWIVDTVTKKRVTYNRFQKLFDLTKSEINHLKSAEVLALYAKDLKKYFKFFEKSRNMQFLLDVNQLSDIEKYRIIANDKKYIYEEVEYRILKFTEDIERNYYKLLINVNVVKGVAYINLDTEIIRRQYEQKTVIVNNKKILIDVMSITDKNGNFILFSS